jgi:hypothetical protein
MQRLAIVITPRHNFKNLKEARDWAKENIVNTFKNQSTGEYIRISKSSIAKYLSQKAVEKSINLEVHLSALMKLPELIETAILNEVKPDRNNDIYIKEIQRFLGAIYYDCNLYHVKITVKVTQYDGNKAYTYEVMEINNPAV